VYEATVDVPVSYLTHYFDLPYTGGGEAVLPKGERVRVGYALGERPLGVYCDPLRYEELHEKIVAADERANELYRGYYLALDTAALVTSFRLISGGAEGGSRDTMGIA
jgi:hypothetical protein